MLLNYIKIALRNLIRHKVYSLINILGLAIGMACAILLLLFVWDELTYDRHNSKYKRIYQVQSHYKTAGNESDVIVTPLPLGKALKDEYPFIEEAVRIYDPNRMYFVNNQGETIRENNIFLADPEIFKVFDHKFIYGFPDGALDAPNTIVLSKALARKYFGEQDPVGKILSRKDGIGYIVKGVYEDLPENASMRHEALISMQDLSKEIGLERYTLASNSITSIFAPIYTYILISEKSRTEDITKDHERFRNKYIAKEFDSPDDDYALVFQHLTDSYLHSQPYPNSPINVLQRAYILSALALFVLAIACINYMNLATARSAGRAMEVGVRKVLGADRRNLIRQFLCESIIITMVAMLLTLILIELSLPPFNNLVGKQLSFSTIGNLLLLSGILIVTLLVGIVAGSYPALWLSSFSPINVLRGSRKTITNKRMLRKILVVIQYAISVTIIICTFILMKQMTYMRNIDLGFNKKDILYMNPQTEGELKSISAFKESILKYNGVLGVARSNIIGGGSRVSSVTSKIESSDGELKMKVVNIVIADFNFIDLMEMKVLEGRSFNREILSDQSEAVIVNETLVKEMGWTGSPIGKRILWGTEEWYTYNVIGVLKDFQFQSLHEKIKPTLIFGEASTTITRPYMRILSIKIRPEGADKTIEFIKNKWTELNPTHPLEITYLDDQFNKLYQTDEATSMIFICSAFLGISISCLGLFGLSSFLAESKKKEIGIRKTFGASIGSIVFKLSVNFLMLVLIASIIACPIAFYAMSKWLENFAYKIEFSWWLFAVAVCIALIIALATVSYHAVKAALTDPVKALRYE